MANPGLTEADHLETLRLLAEHDGNASAAARSINANPTTFRHRVNQARQWENTPVEIREAAKASGVSDPSNISHLWKISKDEDGNGYSVFIKNPISGEEVSFFDMVRDALADGIKKPPKFEKRTYSKQGEHLLVLDLADVHFLKLCVKSETGYTYNRDVARHRVITGARSLLKKAAGMGVYRILLVMGNDVLHVDTNTSTTTSGTPQSSDGTIFQGFRDAKLAMCDVIQQCTKVAETDLIHCMSNHDYRMGWALSQTVAEHFRTHPNVHFSDYNLSEAHRKYYRFGSNLIGLSHGDGAKEEKLYGAMVKEARAHISECPNLYWILHHVHHKERKKRGEGKPFLAEKDHNGMTAHMVGMPDIQGENIDIEYVRSPSPPDGWHDRNGYLNRQAVECFLYHPDDGQVARFTEWF